MLDDTYRDQVCQWGTSVFYKRYASEGLTVEAEVPNQHSTLEYILLVRPRCSWGEELGDGERSG